jgi:transketolase
MISCRILIQDLDDILPNFDTGNAIATRKASGKVLDALMPKLPLVFGGSADLTPSNNTEFSGAKAFQKNAPDGRYIHYGIREHAMGAIMNGISVSGLARAYGGTFLVFSDSDYMRASIRVAAMSKYPTIFVFTHDSIGVGEDGPTHQPVEQLAALRAIPNLLVFRPADARFQICLCSDPLMPTKPHRRGNLHWSTGMGRLLYFLPGRVYLSSTKINMVLPQI